MEIVREVLGIEAARFAQLYSTSHRPPPRWYGSHFKRPDPDVSGQ
jgi:hypothetical protein